MTEVGGRTREESRRLAEELEATGIALLGDVGIEMLVKAADIRRDILEDPRGAMVLLRRVLKDAPRSQLALSRALPLAESLSANEDLVELLALAARASDRGAPRAQLLVRRGDVLAVRLGRIAEARSQYRDAARLAPGTTIASAAQTAANLIDTRLADERAGRPAAEPLRAVLDEPLRFGSEAGSPADTDEVLERLRKKIGVRAPVDHALVMEAVVRGLSRGVDDVAERVLPWMRPERRAALLEEIAIGAEGTSDPTSARLVLGAAFHDAPGGDENFAAMLAIANARGDDESLARTIERRAQALGADELLPLVEEVKDDHRRARVLIELVRTADDLETLEAAIEQACRIGQSTKRPRICARALAAGASHEWLPATRRADILMDMAKILRNELGNHDGAAVVEREAGAMKSRGPDTQPDRPAPPFDESTVAGDTEETTRSLADEVESLVRRQLGDERPPPTDDPVLLIRRGHVDEAVQKVVEGDVETDVALMIARHARRTGMHRRAADALRVAWEAPGASRSAIVSEAVELARRGVVLDTILGTDDELNDDARRSLALFELQRSDDERAASTVETVFSEDPDDAEAAAALLSYYEATRRLGEADILVRGLERVSNPRLVCAVARHHERRADIGRAQALLRGALQRDAARTDVATVAFDIASRAGDDALEDDALEALRLAWFEQGDATAAYHIAAILVARSADAPADRLTYDHHRCHVRRTPKAGIPEDWADDLVGELSSTAPLSSQRWSPLSLDDPALAVLDAVRTAFRMPRIDVAESPDHRVLAGEGPTLALPPLLAAYPNRLRFNLARGVAALADQRLVDALSFEQESDETPPAAVVALDRAGLILSADPALALAEVGPRTARGRAMTAFVVHGGLKAAWDTMGLAIA